MLHEVKPSTVFAWIPSPESNSTRHTVKHTSPHQMAYCWFSMPVFGHTHVHPIVCKDNTNTTLYEIAVRLLDQPHTTTEDLGKQYLGKIWMRGG